MVVCGSPKPLYNVAIIIVEWYGSTEHSPPLPIMTLTSILGIVLVASSERMELPCSSRLHVSGWKGSLQTSPKDSPTVNTAKSYPRCENQSWIPSGVVVNTMTGMKLAICSNCFSFSSIWAAIRLVYSGATIWWKISVSVFGTVQRRVLQFNPIL